MNVMATLHVIDGTYELFRNHFGAPPRQTPEGWEIGAVAGLMSSTLSLLASGDVTHVGAAFDSVIESFRNAMFDGYKTGEGTPPRSPRPVPCCGTGDGGNGRDRVVNDRAGGR